MDKPTPKPKWLIVNARAALGKGTEYQRNIEDAMRWAAGKASDTRSTNTTPVIDVSGTLREALSRMEASRPCPEADALFKRLGVKK
jgi:hypothetical protein